jgi:hypothetical protein
MSNAPPQAVRRDHIAGQPAGAAPVGHADAVEDDVLRPTGPEGLVKVVFKLSTDDDGWPPVGSEGLWAAPVTSQTVRLRNTPWFARGVANGDLVSVRTDEHGVLWADEVLEWSGCCTIRVVPFRAGPLEGSLQRVLDAFAPLRVTGEGLGQYGMVSLEVPADADLPAVKGLLLRGVRDGWWDYEEGCIGDAWADAEPA